MAVVKFTRVLLVETTEISLPSPKPKAISSPLYIRFNGNVGYTMSFDTVTIRFDKIEHNWGSSGTLKVVLWAVANYTGGTAWTGTRMGEYRLETISNGKCYLNKSFTVPRTSPASGSYTMIMGLEACCDGKFVMRDHRVFGRRLDIKTEVKFVGETGYSCKGTSVTLQANRISHNFSAATGTLKLVLWACSDPPHNGTWTGHILAEAQLEPLQPGMSYTDVVKTAELTRPPSGHYHMMLQLQSYEVGGWMSRFHVLFDGLASF